MKREITQSITWLVSIIIPVYNAEKYLSKCLDSVINQTYSNLEIILVDDGSTDRSGIIYDEYAGSDKRIKVIHNTNSGVSNARNTGIRICKGDYVAFIDSDDYVDKIYISSLLEPLMKDDYDIVFCSFLDLYAESNKKTYHLLSDGELSNLTGNFYEDYHAFKEILFYPVLKLYKIDVIRDNNICFPEDFTDGEDQIFNFSYYENVKNYKYINQALYIYCHRSVTSLSSQKTFPSYYSNLEKLKREKAFYKKHNIACCESLLINNAMMLMRRFSIINSVLDYSGFKQRIKAISQVVWEELENIENLSCKYKIVRGCCENNIYFPFYFYCLIRYLKDSLMMS